MGLLQEVQEVVEFLAWQVQLQLEQEEVDDSIRGYETVRGQLAPNSFPSAVKSDLHRGLLSHFCSI